MKALMLDIETTGLDKSKDKVLEVAGGIMETTEDVYSPLSKPFRVLVIHKENLSAPLRVLGMHAATGLWQLLSRLDDDMEKHKRDVLRLDVNGVKTLAVRPDKFFPVFKSLMEERIPAESKSKRLTLGGKNVQFDLGFLCEADPGFSEFFRSRQLDPGMLWIKREDDVPPSLPECLDRCGKAWPGMPGTLAHSAMDDATAAAWAIRGGLKRIEAVS